MHRVWNITIIVCSALLLYFGPGQLFNGIATTHAVAAANVPLIDTSYQNFELQLSTIKRNSALEYEKIQLERAADRQQAIEKAIAATPKRLEAYWWATTQKNEPYVWGGTGPYGYDCSGLVMTAYEREGIYLPRTTFDMLNSSILIPIPESEAKLGDLAFYGTGHVEFFVDNTTTFGAANPVDGIGWHVISSWWAPTSFFRVSGAG